MHADANKPMTRGTGFKDRCVKGHVRAYMKKTKRRVYKHAGLPAILCVWKDVRTGRVSAANFEQTSLHLQ